jgi:ribonuclease BN (tRNA processing enzyme)
MNAVTFLGTGPGDVLPGRGQAALLVECGGQQILLDAGEPCSGRLVELGVPLDGLDAVALTHAHADHVGGLPLLLQAAWLQGRTRPLPVLLPGHLHGPLTAWLDAIFLGSRTLSFPVAYETWSPGLARMVGGVTLTPQPTTHLARVQAELGRPEIQAFALDVQADGRRLVYTGDLGGAEDLAPLVTQPVAVLICEMAHLSGDALISALAGAQIDTLCLTHVGKAWDEQRAEIRLRCERELPGVRDVFLPDDGERIEF